MEFSKQQTAFFNQLTAGTCNIVLIAVAGSGKTTTVLQGIRLLLAAKAGVRIAYTAFNKAIKVDASSKLGFIKGCFVNTMHGFGLEPLTRSLKLAKNSSGDYLNAAGDKWIDTKKTAKLCQRLAVEPMLVSFVEKVVSHAKNGMIGFLVPATSQEPWLAIVAKHDLDKDLIDPDGILTADEMLTAGLRASCKVLKASVESAQEFIDYDDMLYLPIMLKLHVWQYDYVFIDEAQDTNASRRCLAKRMLKTGGRLIAVGDPCQAIYGFTGADNDSLEIIKHEFNAVEMPLTVSYRCPKAIVEFVLANSWHHLIEPAATAINGSVSTASYKDVLTNIQAGDAILCRNNAGLLKCAFALIAKGKACKIEGRNIAGNLVKLATRWKSVHTIPQLIDKLTEFSGKQSAKYMAAGKEMLAQDLDDQVSCLMTVIEALKPAASLADLTAKINSMFVDSNGEQLPLILLSSIHKAKGREWDNVYWLDRASLQPSKYARQQWQAEQEINLMYVAATRAKVDLIEFNSPKE